MRITPLFSIALATTIGCSNNHNNGRGPDASGDSAGGTDACTTCGGTTIALTLTNKPTTASTFDFIVAYQDGTSAWSLAPAPTGDVYSFTVQSPSYAVAWTCVAPATDARTVELGYFTTAEATSLTLPIPDRCTDVAPGNVQVSGTVNKGVTTGTFTVSIGDKIATADQTTGKYTLEIAPGTYDVIAANTAAALGTPADSNVAKTVVVRDVAITGATTQDVDFMTDGAATQSFPVTIAGTPQGATVVATTQLLTAKATSLALNLDTASPFASVSLPAAQMTGTDTYVQLVTVAASGSTLVTSNATATPAAETYSAPAAFGGALASVPTTAPYPLLKLTWSAYANAIGYASSATQTLSAEQCSATANAGCTVGWDFMMSPGYAGDSPSLELPDLSGLAGWTSELQFIAGVAIDGSLEADTSTRGPADFPTMTPMPAGTQRTVARSAWSVTP